MKDQIDGDCLRSTEYVVQNLGRDTSLTLVNDPLPLGKHWIGLPESSMLLDQTIH